MQKSMTKEFVQLSFKCKNSPFKIWSNEENKKEPRSLEDKIILRVSKKIYLKLPKQEPR